MKNSNQTPEELNPTNGNENTDNLQNNSEENTQNENTEKKTPIRDTSLLTDLVEEMQEEEVETTEEREKPTAPRRDPRVWEHTDDDGEDTSEKDNEQETNSKGKKRYDRRNNTRIANRRTTKNLKEKKLARLKGERNTKKADINRGYLIVHLNDDDSDTEHTKHVPLDSSDKEVIRSVISEKENEIFDLEEEIKKIKLEIKEKASVKTSTNKNKLNKKKQAKKENDLVDQVGRGLNKASQNGDEKIISELQQQVKSGKKNEAYDSLKSFLSQQVKTVAKKLDKSEQLEKKVLHRVLESISKVQS